MNDTLWGRNLRPLPDKREMDGSAAHVAGLLRSDADLLQACQQVFGRRPPADAEAAVVDAGKAPAAYIETLESLRTAGVRPRRHALRG